MPFVINAPLTNHFRPSAEVPNPACCNVQGHLCDDCRAARHHVENEEDEMDDEDLEALLDDEEDEYEEDELLVAPGLATNCAMLDPYNGQDDEGDVLPMPVANWSQWQREDRERERRKMQPQPRHATYDDDVLPLPRMSY